MIDKDCNVHNEFPKNLQKPMADLVDAFLYLGPQDLRLRSKCPLILLWMSITGRNCSGEKL